MKRIMMEKYGFQRSAADDFSDDGNRFICYSVFNGQVRVSKLVRDGEAYIAGRIDDCALPYEVYSKLPHYKNMDALNGVSVSTLTDKDLEDFYAACVEYAREYNKAKTTIIYPTYDALLEKATRDAEKAVNEYLEVKNKIDPDQLLLLSEYKLKSFKNYYISLKKRADTGVDKNYIASILNTAYSFTYLERVSTAPSYEYTNCIKILAGE